MSSAATHWRTILTRFDPLAPPDAAWVIPRPSSKVDDLVARICWAPVPVKIVLCGSRGSGNSTELQALQHRLTDARRRALLVDVVGVLAQTGSSQRFDDLADWELVLLLGRVAYATARQLAISGLDRALKELNEAANQLHLAAGRAVPPPNPTALDRLAGGTAAGAAAATGLTPMAALAPTMGFVAGKTTAWISGAAFGRHPAVASDDERALRLRDVVNDLLERLATTEGPVVLLLDGLDRVTEHTGEAATRRWLDSPLLARLGVAMVAAVPRWVGREPAGWMFTSLPEVPVLAFDNLPRPDPAGRAFFRSLYAKRTGDLPADLVPSHALDVLVDLSGGVLRDFVRLVNELAYVCGPEGLRATDEALERVAREWRLNFVEQGLTREDLDLLLDVCQNPFKPPPARAYRLIVTRKLLVYENGGEWHYPHPALLFGNLLGPAQRRISSS